MQVLKPNDTMQHLIWLVNHAIANGRDVVELPRKLDEEEQAAIIDVCAASGWLAEYYEQPLLPKIGIVFYSLGLEPL